MAENFIVKNVIFVAIATLLKFGIICYYVQSNNTWSRQNE